MAGLTDTDIRLSDTWQLTASATGDAPTCGGLDCFVQDIQLEAISQEGELFYDPEWGWGLIEFLHSEDDPLTRLEINQRVTAKLRRRPEIVPSSITSGMFFGDDAIQVDVGFQIEGGELRSFQVSLSRVNVEVKIVD